MSGWGQNQGWGGQQGGQQGWGGQQTGQQGQQAWGNQQQKPAQQGWGTQQQTAQQGWGGQQTGQQSWGTQQTSQQGWGQQGGWGGQQQTGQQSWGTQQQGYGGQQQGFGGQQQGYGGQQQGFGQQPQQSGGFFGGVSGLFDKMRHKTKPNKLTRPYYSIASERANGKVIDICQQGPKQGTLIIWEGYGGPNQSFGITQENGKYLFKCKQPQGYLTVQGQQDGAKFFVSQTKQQGSYFDFQPMGDKKYVVITCYGKAMDIENQDKNNGTSVIQWPIKKQDLDNQIWMLMDPKDITSSSGDRY